MNHRTRSCFTFLTPDAKWLAAASLAVATALGAKAAQADDFVVYSPHVQATQSEIELRGYQYGDPRADYQSGSAAELSLAHAFRGLAGIRPKSGNSACK